MLFPSLLILISFVASRGDNISGGNVSENGNISKREFVGVCDSNSCKKLTSKLLFLMDHNAEPCEEFPEYICGNQDSLKDSHFDEAADSFEKFMRFTVDDESDKYRIYFRDFHRTCVDFEKYNVPTEALEFFTASKQHYSSLTDIMIDVILRQSFPFFDVGLDIDVDTGKYIFQITLPGESVLKTTTDGWSLREYIKNRCGDDLQNSLDLNEIYDDFQKCEGDMLRNFVENYAENVKFFRNMNNTEELLNGILDIQELSLRFMAIHLPKERIWRAKINKDSIKMSIAELNNTYGMINWINFFQGITTSKTFSGDEIVQVHFPNYLRDVFNALKSIEERKLVSMIQEFSRLELYKIFIQPHENRRTFCTHLAQQLMPDVASIIFYSQNTPQKMYLSVYQTKELFNQLTKKLNESLTQSTLEESSKLAFQNKLGQLKLGLITSGNFHNDTLYNNYKDLLDIGPDFKKNLVEVMKNYRKVIFSLFETTASASSLLNYFISPLQDMPQTFYSSNMIVLHPGIYNRIPSNLPDYLILAKIGLLLSQQILKHFDPTGLLFMSNYNKSSDKKYKILVQRTQSLLDTFYLNNSTNYYRNTMDFQNLTTDHLLNELIRDNAAFRLVTDYYQSQNLDEQKNMPWIGDDLTSEQVFLIAATQEFCGRYSVTDLMLDLLDRGRLPLSIKIRNMVSNSEFFSESFVCAEGSAMNLDQDVKIQFPYIDEDIGDDYEEATEEE